MIVSEGWKMISAANNLTELRGTFSQEKWRPSEPDDTYVIGTLTDKTIIVGHAPRGEFFRGLEYVFSGAWETHQKHGKQFRFTSFAKCEPHSRSAVVAYLAKNAPNIGGVRAGKLFDTFGQNAVKVLRTEPERAAAALKTLTLDQAREAATALESLVQLEDTRIALGELFEGRGFPRKLIDEVIRKWGVRAPARIRHDPFCLLVEGFDGAGFARCDTLYGLLGHSQARLKRQLLYVWHWMRKNGNGDTWFRVEKIAAELRRNVNVRTADERDRVDADRAIRLGVRAGWLAQRQDANGCRWIAETEAAASEQRAALKLAELLDALQSSFQSARWPSPEILESIRDTRGRGLTPHQVERAAAALAAPVGLLLGCPGAGKSHVVGAIAAALLQADPTTILAAAAPTGKAAARMSQAFANWGVQVEGATIHRLLEVGRNGHDGKGWGFQRNAINPLPYDVIFVDEASMIDTPLFAQFLDACRPGTMLLFVGDTNQLPPVGHGAPLRDMISAGVPHGELTEIVRNSGDITKVCAAIREGRTWAPSPKISIPAGHNLKHFECRGPAEIICRLREQFLSAPPSVDRIWDCQVFTAINPGELGRITLNEMLQALLNPKGHRIDGNAFRVGDKVICTQSGYQTLCDEDGEPVPDTESWARDPLGDERHLKEHVANGEIGRLLIVQPGAVIVRFDPIGGGNARIVKMPAPVKKGKQSRDKGAAAAGDTEKEDDSETDAAAGTPVGKKAARGQVELAYALTVHKGQGSQAEFVFLIADPSRKAEMVACRELVYTGISRAEVLTTTIGPLSVLRRWCRDVALKGRKTFLRELIVEAIESRKGAEVTV
jgi:exodeoxyribonuclease V alpha subunit